MIQTQAMKKAHFRTSNSTLGSLLQPSRTAHFQQLPQKIINLSNHLGCFCNATSLLRVRLIPMMQQRSKPKFGGQTMAATPLPKTFLEILPLSHGSALKAACRDTICTMNAR
jgi:hypothetical protein